MVFVMENKAKCWFYLLIFKTLFESSLCIPLLGIQGLDNLNSLTSILDLKKGSKLQLLEMLSGALMQTPDGGTVREGDIVNYPSLYDKIGKRDDDELWPNGLIPYMFHSSVDQDHKNLLTEAMEHWEERTCIRFKPKNIKDKHYVRFRTDLTGCWSAVGRQIDKPGAQDISLGAGCFKFYTAIHEIGHTIGYFHEHSRNDREKYIEILWDNVKPGMNVQFKQRITRNEIFEYDYRSVMHYPAWAFSRRPLKENVVLSKNPFSQYKIDEEKNQISFRDIKLTNSIYKCNEKCTNSDQVQCQNGGVLAPIKSKGKKKCACLCPQGFFGELCEITDVRNNFDPEQPKCGGNVTNEGIITTPNYPFRKEGYESCTYWIRASIDHRVRVTFQDFSFAPSYGSGQGLCLYESIEIRKTESIYRGSIYCEEQIPPNTVMESEDRDFIIIIVADDQKRGRGLKANIEFFLDKQKAMKATNPEQKPSKMNKQSPEQKAMKAIKAEQKQNPKNKALMDTLDISKML